MSKFNIILLIVFTVLWNIAFYTKPVGLDSMLFFASIIVILPASFFIAALLECFIKIIGDKLK